MVGVALTFACFRYTQKSAVIMLLGCVSIVKERTVTGLPHVNTASLEDDIRRLIEEEFGPRKSKAPEAGLFSLKYSKAGANRGSLVAAHINRVQSFITAAVRRSLGAATNHAR